MTSEEPRLSNQNNAMRVVLYLALARDSRAPQIVQRPGARLRPEGDIADRMTDQMDGKR